MIEISNKSLKYGLLFLIVINIQIFVAQNNVGNYTHQGNHEDNHEDNHKENHEEETTPRISRCMDLLPDPNVITNGKYIIEKTHEDEHGNSLELRFICNEDNFVLVPPLLQTSCKNGKWWLPVFPKCLPVCDYDNWKSSWTECVPECGLSKQPVTYSLANKLQPGDYPYHVGIYFKLRTKEKNELKYVCGGSIITLRLVITEPYCVTNIDGTVISLELYDVFVGAGKFYNDYESVLDLHAQKRKVMKIVSDGNSYQTMEVLVADVAFSFDNYVQPVCIETFDPLKDYYVYKELGYIVGWGNNEHKYSALSSRLVSVISIANDEHAPTILKKICDGGDSNNGCDICVGDIGSGFVALKNIQGVNKYYLQQIVSGKYFRGTNCADTWIANYNEYPSVDETIFKMQLEYPNIMSLNSTLALKMSTNCRVPFISNGRLLISGKPYSSMKPIPNHSIVYIECHANTYLYPSYTKYIICHDGKFIQEVPKCSRKCPLLESPTVNSRCELNRVLTECASSSFEGTTVTQWCITRYSNMLSADQHATAVCRDGVWDQPLLTCEPVCRNSRAEVLIYENISNADSPTGKYICGGSILSDNIILSAAQCFTNQSNGELLNLGSFFVYAGERNEGLRRKIVDVKTPHEYKGKVSNYTGNLALVKLDKPLPLNRVHSIGKGCYNYDTKLEDGLIYHFDSVPNQFHSDWTRYNVTECIYDITKDMETSDKFCVGTLYYRSTSVCPGAVYYSLQGSYSLGVASLHRPNKSCSVAANEKFLITEIKNYRTFIDSGIEELSVCKIVDIQNCSFTVSNRNYNINASIPNFSTIRVKCNKNFQIFPPFVDSILCADGKYDQFPSCIECGQLRQLDVKNNSIDSVTAAEIPWQVEIYHNLTHKCAGTLINPRIIITNSLCFADTVDDYKITVGWQNVDDLSFTQRQTVNKQEIKIKDDIALAILKDRFNLSETIHPICIDWKDELGYQEMISSEPGIVFSSNLNNADKNENEKWKIQLFFDVDSSEVFLQGYDKPLMPNYFSAKTNEGPSNCLHDIGSGIAIKNIDGVYFLRGVMTSVTNESLTFCTFIKISYYLPFIINIVESIELL